VPAGYGDAITAMNDDAGARRNDLPMACSRLGEAAGGIRTSRRKPGAHASVSPARWRPPSGEVRADLEEMAATDQDMIRRVLVVGQRT
jgi:hypothetical protein